MADRISDFFKGKKITLMGLGLLGRGSGDAEFMAKQGADILVTDLKDKKILNNSVEMLEKYPNIKFRLGGHDVADFTNCDMVIKSAGVPLDSPYIKAAEAAGVPVYMSTALFVYLSGIKTIGVTGTRGKSTVTQMIYECLKAAGCLLHLGGNVRGLSTLSLLPEVKPNDIAVLELDSWQLQGFRTLKISPHVAVFTNLMPDHMNYYDGSMEQYFYDKSGIFRHQNVDDYLVIHSSIHTLVDKEKPVGCLSVVEDLPENWNLKIPGKHNRQSAALALKAVEKILPEGKETIVKQTLENYQAVEGRLSFVSEVGGVKFYNDSNATTPEATIAALNSFEKGKICLIAGGSDKELDLDALKVIIKERCKKVVFVKGSGTDRLIKDFSDVSIFNSMKEAFEALIQYTSTSDIFLLSPAFTSYGLYQNEYERSDDFNQLVHDYKKSYIA